MQLHDMTFFQGRREFEQLLRRSFLFGDTSPILLRRLLDALTLFHCGDGEVVCRQGEAGDACYIIVSGAVRILYDDGRAPRSLAVLRAGDCFGEMAMLHDAPRTATAVTVGETELLLLDKRAFQGLLKQSRGFACRARALVEQRVETMREPIQHLVWIDNRTAHKSEMLAQHIAQALSAFSGETAALLHVGGIGGATMLPAGVQRRSAPLDDRLEAALRAFPERYLLCYAEPAQQATALDALGAHITTELRFLSEGPAAPHSAEKFVHDVWVGPAGRRRAAGDLLLPIEKPLGPVLAGEPGPARAAFGRIARAVARRRVGVALSGGGAWGLGHCALLAGLCESGIPVDVIAGSSTGAFVGAAFACRGTDGLTQLLSIRNRIGVGAALSVVSTWPVEYLIRHYLGDVNMAALDPCLLTVALDLMTARERVFRSGSTSLAVRASCAAPGVYGPALHEGGRYVDGALTNNVPVSALRDEGCDFVIASTMMSAPPVLRREEPVTRIGRAWAELSPLLRMRDVTRSLMTLGHTVSRDLAAAADVVFAPDLSPYQLSEWSKGDEIVRRAKEQLAPVLALIKRRYAAL